jgi:hypothetical protein
MCAVMLRAWQRMCTAHYIQLSSQRYRPQWTYILHGWLLLDAYLCHISRSTMSATCSVFPILVKDLLFELFVPVS